MIDEQEKPWEDPIVAELRAIRDAYAKKFNYDLKAIVEDIKKGEAEDEAKGYKFVNFPPKRISKRTGTRN